MFVPMRRVFVARERTRSCLVLSLFAFSSSSFLFAFLFSLIGYDCEVQLSVGRRAEDQKGTGGR
jgi:hypothetical protein